MPRRTGVRDKIFNPAVCKLRFNVCFIALAYMLKANVLDPKLSATVNRCLRCELSLAEKLRVGLRNACAEDKRR